MDSKSELKKVSRVGGVLALLRRVWETKRDQLTWTALRVTVGLLWLNSFWGKFTNPAYVSGFAATNRGFAAKTSFGFYRDFLNSVVIPNADFWANLTMYGELLVGVALVLGLLTNVGAVAGFFLNLNFWMAAGQTGSTFSVNIVMGTAGLLFALSPGAKWLSVDRLVAERLFPKVAQRHAKLVKAFLQRPLAL